jgi:hypothetical protein
MKHISQSIPIRRGARYRKPLLLGAAILLAAGLQQARGSANHLNLFPKLSTGQTLTYQIAYHSEKQAKTHSSVVMAQSPAGADIDVHGLLRLEVLGVEPMGARSIIHARTWFQSLDSATNINVPDTLQTPPSQVQKQDPTGIAVEFTLSPDGRVDQIQGLDALYPEQQQAWQQWAFRFAATAAFPEKGVQLAQKWKSEESEKSPSPIANLTWIRESVYVRNEPCRASQLTIQGNVAESAAQPETCAVILTTANLKQKSSPKDATPEDYKLHQLKTTGSAGGSNKTLLYISIQSGLLIRSSDHADQSMSVTIAKSDGSNRVHYDVHAKSDTEIFRIANTPLDSK